MKKALLCFLSFLIGTNVFAQDDQLSVISFGESMALYAQTNQKMVRNDAGELEPAAVVVAEIPTDKKVSFKSGYLVKEAIEGSTGQKVQVATKKEGNSYYVYMHPGAKKLEIAVEAIGTISVSFGAVSDGGIPSLKSKMTYDLKIRVPQADTVVVIKNASYENHLQQAREMYNNRNKKTNSDYFVQAELAYKQAMAHKDCPETMIPVLRTEQNEMVEIGGKVYDHEVALRHITQTKHQYGDDADTTYYWLKMACRISNNLRKNYPSDVFQQMYQNDTIERGRHPLAKKAVTRSEQVQRNSAYGLVTQKIEYIPYNSIGIYATKVSKPQKDDDKQRIGTVNSDRTYQVTMPDGYYYIIFDGEKEGHPVSQANQEINVFIK